MILKIKRYIGLVLLIAAFWVIDPTKKVVASCVGGNARDCLAESEVNPIMSKLSLIISFMSATIFVLAVIMLIVGGIQYMTANGNPQAVADAKKKITNVFIGIVAFVFLWAFLEWLIPGGVWK